LQLFRIVSRCSLRLGLHRAAGFREGGGRSFVRAGSRRRGIAALLALLKLFKAEEVMVGAL
jgi:hypothetical protein